jgi:conjugative relaxase-like TrwC/TraI family protein
MISVGQISSAGGAAKYYTEEQDRLEYYQGEKAPSEWKGVGAKISGMEGAEVTRENLEAMLAGRVKEVGEHGQIIDRELGRVRVDQKTGEKILEHRAGWDFTFSAPKSVSIEAEVFGREDAIQAHREAVEKAMGYLERHAQARIGGKTVETGNLTYASFEHATTRAGDPQTHTHVIVTNVTYDEGKAYSLESKGLYEARHAADNVYKNEMAKALEARGYQLEWDAKGNFEIRGYSREQIEVFSKRSEEIAQELRERGVTRAEASAEERQIATLVSRQEKNHAESREAHAERWQEEAKAHGIRPAERGELRDRGEVGMAAAREAVFKAMAHITDREAAFKEVELYKEAARLSQGKASLEDLDKAVQEACKAGELRDRGDGKLTTREMQDLEKGLREGLERGRGAHAQIMDRKEFEKAVREFEAQKSKEAGKEFRLSAEQKESARMILVGSDRFQGVQGLAGTGKTTMLEFVRKAAESKGWEVRGFSTGAAQAQKLEAESGIRSQTTKSFLMERKGDDPRARRDAELAKGALRTFERGKVSERKLEKLEQDPRTKKAFDSQGRVYLIDRKGKIYQPDLHRQNRVVESRNLRHGGLTRTRYVIGKDGVFKQGGTLYSELAGKVHDKLRQGVERDYRRAMDQVRRDVARNGGRVGILEQTRVIAHRLNRDVQKGLLSVGFQKAERWQKAGALESLVVRAKAAIQQRQARAELVKELKAQATSLDRPMPKKTLYIHDEASQAGIKEFREVMKRSEQDGARTVFLGDRLQHQSVEAGKAFEQAQRHMPMAEMTEIRRQKTEETKSAVRSVLEGRHGEAIAGSAREVRDHQEAVKARYEGRTLTDRERQTMRAELRAAAREDSRAVIREIAKDFAARSAGERDRTAIITSTNADRREINAAVREELKARGELQGEREFRVLEKKDISDAERRAAAYERGDVVRFTSAHRALGVERGAEGRVLGKDDRANRVKVALEDGRIVHMRGDLRGVEAAREVTRSFAEGDRIAFLKNDKEAGFKNGESGKILEISGNRMTVEVDGQRRNVDLDRYRHIDHGYATTSVKAQGQSIEKVLVHHNTEQGRHGDRETYVNLTRAKTEVKVYTNDLEKAQRQAGMKLDKEAARAEPRGKDADQREQQREADREAAKVATGSDKSKDKEKEVDLFPGR